MKYREPRGFIPGKAKVAGDSLDNDVVDIHGSPGEVIIDRETLSKGPHAILNFVQNAVATHKKNFADGGMVAPTAYQGVQNYFSPSQDASQAQAANIIKPDAERIRQLEAVRDNLRPLNSSEASEYNTLKARQSQNYAQGGMVQPSFDPDKFLNETAPHFDPDQFLAETGGNPKPETSLGDKLQTGLESFGNAVSLGYLPHLQAAAAPAIYGALNTIEGTDVKPDSYVDERDANIARQQAENDRNPKSAMAGTGAGIIAGALATPELPFLKGGGGLMSSLAKGAVKGAGIGAVYGAAQNPGDMPGQVDPTQWDSRMDNAEHGAKVGALVGTGAGLLGKGIEAMSNSADTAQGIANQQAVKASGGMLKDMRVLNAKDKLDDLGKFALDNGLVEAGDKVDDVADKANTVRKQAASKLDDVYSIAQDAASKSDGSANIRGFNPVQNKQEILSYVAEKLGDSPDKRSAMRAVETYLDQLGEDHGDQILSPKTANNVKTQLDQQINYSRNPMTANPSSEKGFSAMRDYVAEAVNNHVEDLGKATGNDDLAGQLQRANKEYGYAKQIENMANDRVNRNMANKMFGLTDTIAAGTGAATGAMIHGPVGAVIGAGAGIANKVASTYGPGIIASGANQLAKVLPYTVEPIAKTLQSVPADAASKFAIQGGLQNPPQPKGYQKWYNDGLQNLMTHVDDPNEIKNLQQMKTKLMSSQRGQSLLLEASSLPSGSKRLDRVLSDIKELQ